MGYEKRKAFKLGLKLHWHVLLRNRWYSLSSSQSICFLEAPPMDSHSFVSIYTWITYCIYLLYIKNNRCLCQVLLSLLLLCNLQEHRLQSSAVLQARMQENGFHELSSSAEPCSSACLPLIFADPHFSGSLKPSSFPA